MEFVEVDATNVSEFVTDIAGIHKSSYDGSHFTSLFSLEKLGNYYHSLVIASDVSICCIEDGRTVGFVISGESVSCGVTSFIKKNRLYLSALLLTHPKFLLQKVRQKIEAILVSDVPSRSSFRLLSVAVAPQYHSKGIGSKILKYFEQILSSRNVSSYGLSVRIENIQALNFYIKMGFKVEKSQLGSIYLVKNLVERE